jgi:hypothetical protein
MARRESLRGPFHENTWTDEMTRLSMAVPGMLPRGNVYCFDHALKNLPDHSPILEIGSFCGLSACMITLLKRRHNVKNQLICVDSWEFTEAGFTDATNDFIQESFQRNTKHFCPDDPPRAFRMTSDEFFQSWKQKQQQTDNEGKQFTMGGPLSFCYIDGDHSREAVKRDFMNCSEHLSEGGFILFDNSADGSVWEVNDVTRKVKRMKDYRLIARNPNYFFQKVR